MPVDFASSETRKNLMRAFAGESQARNRYYFAAAQAKKNGLQAMEAIFRYTADQEQEHAEIFYKHLKELEGETIHIDGGYPVELYEDTAQAMRAAQHDEYEEHDVVYKAFGDKAMEEGFPAIASSFYSIAAIEKTHGDRFGYFAALLEGNRLYLSEDKSTWLCLNCGHIHTGKAAPAICPVCSHDRGYFIPIQSAPYQI